jgi:uncharacterized protein YdaU (DUF1376 family)
MPRDKNGHFYYGWYPTIVKSDTAHLKLAEDGAYRRLIDEYMVTRCPLPADDQAISRLIGIGLSEWLSLKPKVINFFKPTNNPPGFLSHGFCDRELHEDSQRIEKARENGKRGGRPKSEEPDPNPSGNPTPKGLLDSQIKSNQIRTDQKIESDTAAPDSFKFKDVRFDLDLVLKDESRDEARRLAPGWDLHVLMNLFNDAVRSGKFTKPTRPDSAFLAWVPKFTKGKRP